MSLCMKVDQWGPLSIECDFTFRLQQRLYIQTVLGYREGQLDVFSWLFGQTLRQVDQVWVYGLNQS